MLLDKSMTLKDEKVLDLAQPPVPLRPIVFPQHLPVSTHYPWGIRFPTDYPYHEGLYFGPLVFTGRGDGPPRRHAWVTAAASRGDWSSPAHCVDHRALCLTVTLSPSSILCLASASLMPHGWGCDCVWIWGFEGNEVFLPHHDKGNPIEQKLIKCSG